MTRGAVTFRHGVHPPEHKQQTAGMALRRLPFAPQLIVPLAQHVGAPAKAIVREGQEVVRGEPIAEADGFVSVPMHAPVTGVVERIALAPTPKGTMTEAIYLKTLPAASQAVLYGAERDIGVMTQQELIDAVQATGIVGLGGAAFPTHVKLAVPDGKQVETILVNGCECEPYLTTDHRVMVERTQSVLMGAEIVRVAMGASRIMIGIENNKQDAIAALRAATADPRVTVHALKTKYPQGAEKMLITALLGREVPSGGLPFDVGVAVFNVTTLCQIGDLLPQRQGLIERVITITGDGVERPGNYLTAIGTPLAFLLKHAGAQPDAQIILGGPMMGPAVVRRDLPTTKGITGILVTRPPQRRRKIFPCISCGACLKACPLYLNPARLGVLARFGRYEEMAERYHLKDCFECGSCAYVCPSGIPLVQHFRVAKSTLRKAGKL
jgi:electron transport complex protein RnfC